MKMNFKHYGFALAAVIVGGTFGACTSDDNLAPGAESNVIEIVKSPDVIAYSGNHVWGSTFNGKKLGTRGADVNGNMWYQTWDRPSNVTDEERAKVLEEFSKVRENVVNDIHIDWENYWVQQVYKGEQTYSDHYGNNRGAGSDYMNEFSVYDDNQQVWWPVQKNGGYTAVNNFNHGDNTTTYTDGETGETYYGTTLMTGMSSKGSTAENQFAYKNSVDGGQYYFDYIILEIDGEYYIGFDFFADNRDNPTATANKDHYVDRDWIFNDWIIKITPAYLKGTTPEKPEVTDPTPTPEEDKCEECGDENAHHNADGVCSDCQARGAESPCYTPETSENPGTGEGEGEGDNTKPGVAGDNHTNEVEVNLHGTDKGDDLLESHLSIHVRAATDVEIFIPIPQEYYVEADDMEIVMKHEPNHMVHGGPYVLEYTLKDSNPALTVTLTIAYEEGGIRITTDGITQEVIDWCREKCDDGITFEIWNYFDKDVIDLETLKGYLNQATIKFLDETPDYYINAFEEKDGNKDPDDCRVDIVDEQRSEFNDNPTVGGHLNGSDKNVIYTNKDVDQPDGDE